jgi:hypothetical protein
MITSTGTSIWSIISLSLLLKVSGNKNIFCIHSSLAISSILAGTSSSLSALDIPNASGRRRRVAFVSACRNTFDTNTDRRLIITATASSSNNNSNSKKASPQKTMDFLKRIGKVGNTVADTECLIGVDEGNAGGCTTATGKNLQILEERQETSLTMRTATYRSCIETGIIDDMTNEFPCTNTGTRWDVFTYVLIVYYHFPVELNK